MQCCHHSESHASCIEHVPIFSSLSHEERMEIMEIASSRIFAKGETVYRAGDEGGTLFVLYTGRVKLFRLNVSGKEQVLRLVEPGEFIGELSLFSSLPLTENRIENISLSSVTTRVSRALLELSEGKQEIILPMTKGDLASQLGMTQETLSRKLAALQEEGLILLKGHRNIIIKDKSALEEISIEQ